MFSKLLDKISSNKKNILWVIVFISLFFILSDSAFADEAAKTDAQKFAETKQSVSNVLKWIGTTISVFLALLTYLATVFLSPEWINGSLFGLNGYFKSVWVLVSNVVYLIFAFILIWIAFMNIIGKGQDKYALKQALPKFIVGILIVPFSWFLIQFILSLSAILTISALNLPFETFSKFNTSLSTTKIPTKCELNLKTLGESKEGESKEEAKKFFSCGDETKTLDQVRKSEDSVDSIFGVIGLYTYGLLSIESMDKLNDFDIKSITNMTDLVVKLLFDVLFIIVYSILIIAIGLVLMVRGIYIWIYMMISPLFGLMYFFDKTSGGGEFFDKFNLKQFISLAFVPVYTMLALSFGLLFIYAAGNGMSYNSEFKDIATVKLSDPKGGDQDLTVGSFNLKIVGSPSNPQNITDFFKSISDGGMGIIGTLIMKIFGIVVLWGVVMAALRSNDITKAIVEPLHAFGGQVGGLITKAPQYAPIFGGQSMNSMSQIGSAASNYYTNTLPGKKSSDFMQKHGLFGNDKTTVDSNDIRNALNRNMNDVGPTVKKALINAGEASIASNKEDLISALLEVAKKLDPNGIYKDKKATDIKGNQVEFVKLNQFIDGKLTTSGVQNPDIFGDKIATVSNGNTAAYNEWIKKQKDGKSSEIQEKPSGNTNQTVKLDIKNEGLADNLYKTDGSGKIDGVNNAQTVASNISGTNLLTREQFIDEFVKKLVSSKGTDKITDENARKIAGEVADKIKDFKKNN